MKVLYPDIVNNSKLLVSHFGSWPSFIDCEVISITLNRELRNDLKGPTVDISFYVYELGPAPELGQLNGASALFRFYGAEDVNISEFNHQNQFDDLLVEPFYSERLKRNRFKIHFDGFGANVTFTCDEIEILSVEPYTPPDY